MKTKDAIKSPYSMEKMDHTGKRRNICHIIMECILIIMIFAFGGCTKYASSYKTTLCVSNNTSGNAFIRFSTFEGMESFKLKCKSENGGVLRYSAKLGEGSATIYYDVDDTKKELFTISAGESVEDSIELTGKGTVYIILETSEKCKSGDFEFDIENK